MFSKHDASPRMLFALTCLQLQMKRSDRMQGIPEITVQFGDGRGYCESAAIEMWRANPCGLYGAIAIIFDLGDVIYSNSFVAFISQK